MLEGKRSGDTSVMSWWCAQNNIDGSRVINKLHSSGYLKLADYKFNLEKAKSPALEEFLREHNLPTKGKKGELVNRIVENIDKDRCLAHFKESYWAFTSKATDLLQEERAKAQAEYRAVNLRHSRGRCIRTQMNTGVRKTRFTRPYSSSCDTVLKTSTYPRRFGGT
jgi:hypothetical protein